MKARTRSRTATTSGGRVKSIAMGDSSDLFVDVGAGQVQQALGDLIAEGHAVVLRLALVPAEVELLHDDRHLEEAEGVVVRHPAHVVPAALAVARDRLRARHEAG